MEAERSCCAVLRTRAQYVVQSVVGSTGPEYERDYKGICMYVYSRSTAGRALCSADVISQDNRITATSTTYLRQKKAARGEQHEYTRPVLGGTCPKISMPIQTPYVPSLHCYANDTSL